MNRNSLVVGTVAIVAVLVVFGVGRAEAPNPDPFALENRDPRSLAKRQESEDSAVRVDFKATLNPAKAAPGQTVKLIITGMPRKGYHTYPVTVRANTDFQLPSQLSKIKLQPEPGLQLLWPVEESPRPEWHKDPNVKDTFYLVYEKEFSWSQDLLILPDANPGERTVRVTIDFNGCDEKNCKQLSRTLEMPLTVTAAGARPLSPELQQRAKAPMPEIKVLTKPLIGTTGSVDIITLLLTSMGAAIAMLFTPCVFPMIPITVSFFLKQSEKKHHNAPLTAAIYSVTIIIVLALAVLLLGKLIVDWANSAWLNLALAAVLLVFAFSLFGMYDIELPSFLSRWTSAGEGRGGYLGAVFMALTFTITSFTCTGPFLGPLLIMAKEAQLDLFKLILASVAYAATFAAPFFVLALFPGLLKRLPKSGGWLNAVKVVMGFLELAAALKFLANVDITLNPGNPWFFTYDSVLVAWIGLSVICGIYLLGVIRLPHDTPQEHIGVPRLVLATLFIGLGIYMTPALWRETPSGIIGQGVVAFLPLDTKPKKDDPHLDFQAAWNEAKEKNKLIFIDFTGVNCTNCRANEDIFKRPSFRDKLENYVVVRLYNDTVPDPDQSREKNYQQAQVNRALQENTFGDVSTPLYIILRPDGDVAIKDGKIQGTELASYAGYIHDRPAFLEMLQNPGRVAEEQ
jgi:thiol:disulfide interchange protein DsbD